MLSNRRITKKARYPRLKRVSQRPSEDKEMYLPRLSIGKPILSNRGRMGFSFLNREYGSQNIICLKPSPMICRETTIEERKWKH